MRPESLYKYCPIYGDDFENERSIENLIKSQAVFSSRKNFNDLFDCKVNFIKPSQYNLKRISQKMPAKKRHEFRSLYLGDNFEENYSSLENETSKLFDDYVFYCMTDKPDNNLMWAHYANSHKGFCIEWDSEKIKGDLVCYVDDIPDFNLFDALRVSFGVPLEEDVSDKVWSLLTSKLKEWEYESEYRLLLSNKTLEKVTVEIKDKCRIIKYPQSYMKSIIFGSRMTEEARKYLLDNLPFDIKFKEAYEGRSSIKIRSLT